MESATESDSSSSSSSYSFPDLHLIATSGDQWQLDSTFMQLIQDLRNKKNRCKMTNDVAVEFYATMHMNSGAIDKYGNTPLYWAVYYGHFEIVDRLVSVLKFPVNWQNYSGETALSAAVSTGNYDMVEYLLQNGANPNLGNASEETPLHFAACLDNTSICKLLLEHGAWVYLEDCYGDTPLHWAVREELSDNVKLLLQFGANPHQENDDHESPQQLAEIFGCSFYFNTAVSSPMDLGKSEAGLFIRDYEMDLDDDFEMSDYDSEWLDYMAVSHDSEEHGATIIPSSVDEKTMAFSAGEYFQTQYVL